MSKYYYCGEVMKDEHLKSLCKNIHGAAKCVAGESSIDKFFAAPVSKVSKSSFASSSSTSGKCLTVSGGRKASEDLIITVPPPNEEIEEPSGRD
jgi:hypothetical protein